LQEAHQFLEFHAEQSFLEFPEGCDEDEDHQFGEILQV
jgi:hypothetical protein